MSYRDEKHSETIMNVRVSEDFYKINDKSFNTPICPNSDFYIYPTE
jgi:hypothetical protein